MRLFGSKSGQETTWKGCWSCSVATSNPHQWNEAAGFGAEFGSPLNVICKSNLNKIPSPNYLVFAETEIYPNQTQMKEINLSQNGWKLALFCENFCRKSFFFPLFCFSLSSFSDLHRPSLLFLLFGSSAATLSQSPLSFSIFLFPFSFLPEALLPSPKLL